MARSTWHQRFNAIYLVFFLIHLPIMFGQSFPVPFPLTHGLTGLCMCDYIFLSKSRISFQAASELRENISSTQNPKTTLPISLHILTLKSLP